MKKLNLITLSIQAAILVGISSNVYAFAEQQTDEEVERIEITGSNIARSEIEGPQQLTVITADDMKAQGSITVFDALTNLSQNGVFQFEGPESALFTPGVQTLNLRGIGVGNTLVLLNGRRAANYPGAYQSSTSVFNFGSIPAAAIERIEVLSTGASAIYGSDAVAGVINIILKKNVEETTVDYMYGTPTGSKSALPTHRLQVVTGTTFDKGSITAAFEYQDREAILADDYHRYDDNVEDYPYAERHGEAFRDRINLELDRWNHWQPGDTYVDPGGQEACDAIGNGTVYSYRPGSGNFCGFNGAKSTNFRNDSRHMSLLISGDYQLNNDVRLFSDLLFYSSDSRSNNDRTPYISEEILEMDNMAPNPFGIPMPNWVVRQRAFTEEELQMSMDETFEDFSWNLTMGAEGDWGDHSWTATFTHSAYDMDSKRPWWKAQEYLDTFLGEIAPVFGGVSFFGDNWYTGEGTFGILDNAMTPITDSNRDLITNALGFQSYGNETSSTSLNLKLSGDLFDLPAGLVQYALVLDYEKQDFQFIPDDLILQDAPIPNTTGSGWYQLTGYNGGGDRTRSAIGLELLVPVTEDLTANLAGRVDNYDSDSSSIGTRFTPSVTLEWRPSDNFLGRAGYTESFRAPDLNMVYTETGAFRTTYDYVSCLQQYQFENGGQAGFDKDDCDSGSSFYKRKGAQEIDPNAEGLQDETGYSIWYGLSWDINDELSVTADWTRMKLEDVVDLEDLQGLLDDEYECYVDSGNIASHRCDYVAARLKRITNADTGISYIDEFSASAINQSQELLEVLDMTGSYRTDTDFGIFAVNLSYTHTLKYDQKIEDDSPWIDLRDDPFEGGWTPRSTITGNFNWSKDDLSATLSFNRMGSTTVRRPSELEDGEYYRVSKYMRWNFNTRYQVNDDLSIALTVNNLFNERAPKDATHSPTQDPWYNIYVYSGASIGREFYVNASYKF